MYFACLWNWRSVWGEPWKFNIACEAKTEERVVKTHVVKNSLIA